MRSYLRKYFFRSLSLFFFGAVLLAVIITAVANFLLAGTRKALEENSRKYFAAGISMGSTLYLPFNTFVFKDVVIPAKAGLQEARLISLDNVRIVFSLGEFLRSGRFVPERIYLNRADIDYFNCSSFLRENPSYILTLIASLPRVEKAHVILSDAFLRFPGTKENTTYLMAKSDFKIEEGFVSVFGSFGMESRKFTNGDSYTLRFKVDPLLYNLSGVFTPKGFEVQDLELVKKNSYLKLWGMMRRDAMKLKGFSSIYNFFKVAAVKKHTLTFTQTLKMLFWGYRTVRPVRLAPAHLNIVDIDSSFKFNFPDIYIEDISFYVDNIPFSASGIINLSKPRSWDIAFSSYPGQAESKRYENPRSFDLKLAGSFNEGKVDAEAELGFLRKTRGLKSKDRLQAILKGASLSLVEAERLNVDIERVILSYIAGARRHSLFFKELDFLFDFGSAGTKLISFDSRLADGYLEGKGFLDITHFPFRNFFTVKIRNVSAEKMDSLLSHFSKVKGKLNSQIQYRNYPQTRLYGQIFIDEGYLDNLEFFKWLANFFKLEQFSKLDFDKISTRFSVDNEGARLENINLISQDVGIEGYFGVDEDDLVSSKLSLVLSRRLLEESVKFNSLLKLLGPDFSELSFDFQLSGDARAMNIHWLESDFKLGLKKAIPDFIERSIEAKLEKIIKSISAK
ncbi:MAG: hypothetical protein JW734_05740 [Candidatus Omnitrophica bacterium]|nr:hypothetical protein [Candidatus Omnitrophota bacterium]